MSESERRRKYRYNRVLIETERILDPAFADAVVFLSGAQIEMLRNVTQYLNRLETYVTEYNPGYYLAPTVEEYDDILEIVADLEETLMGNPNTIWGYADRWLEECEETSTGGAQTWVDMTPVPEGYVYVLEQWNIRHEQAGGAAVTLRFFGDGDMQYLYDVPALPFFEDVMQTTHITLKEDDYVRFLVAGLADTKRLWLTVSGYMMVVPS